jgi:hypothetical protein
VPQINKLKNNNTRQRTVDLELRGNKFIPGMISISEIIVKGIGKCLL